MADRSDTATSAPALPKVHRHPPAYAATTPTAQPVPETVTDGSKSQSLWSLPFTLGVTVLVVLVNTLLALFLGQPAPTNTLSTAHSAPTAPSATKAAPVAVHPTPSPTLSPSAGTAAPQAASPNALSADDRQQLLNYLETSPQRRKYSVGGAPQE